MARERAYYPVSDCISGIADAAKIYTSDEYKAAGLTSALLNAIEKGTHVEFFRELYVREYFDKYRQEGLVGVMHFEEAAREHIHALVSHLEKNPHTTKESLRGEKRRYNEIFAQGFAL